MLLRNSKDFSGTERNTCHNLSTDWRRADGPGREHQGLIRYGLHLIFSEPGLLSLALDPFETMSFMDLLPDRYAQLCASGQLQSVVTGRDFFEPLMQFHSFWDILHFRLSTANHPVYQFGAEACEEFFDHIANDLETTSIIDERSFFERIDEAVGIMLDDTGMHSINSHHRRVAHETIRRCVIDMLSDFGVFCHCRMTKKDTGTGDISSQFTRFTRGRENLGENPVA